MRLLTTNEFISKAKALHGEIYQYHKTIYIRGNVNVEIICLVHGAFFQEASSHLQGRGCKECGIIKNRIGNTKFIAQSQIIHGDKYGYERVEYISKDTKVEIICPVHGKFIQFPVNHLAGNGCPKCGGKHKRPSTVLSNEDFIERAISIHGDLYDYSLIDYKNNRTFIPIVCRKHGIFLQRPKCHLERQGCPRCGHYISKPETQWLDSLDVPIRHTESKFLVEVVYESMVMILRLIQFTNFMAIITMAIPKNMILIFTTQKQSVRWVCCMNGQ